MASVTLTFQFMPILSQPPTPCAAVKNLALSSSKTHRYKKAAIRSFQNLLFSRLNTASSIILSSKDRWSQPLGHPLLNLLQFLDVFLVLGQNWLHYSRFSLTSAT